LNALERKRRYPSYEKGSHSEREASFRACRKQRLEIDRRRGARRARRQRRGECLRPENQPEVAPQMSEQNFAFRGSFVNRLRIKDILVAAENCSQHMKAILG
jgi:hypothetical protein